MKWFLLHVPKNVVIEKPIHVFIFSKSRMKHFYNTRNLLVVEEGAKVEVIESHHNFDETYVFTNSVTEILQVKTQKQIGTNYKMILILLIW